MRTFIPVLLDHSVSNRAGARSRRWTVSPSEFAAHIGAVSSSGRTPLTVSEIAEGLRGERALPARPVGITFDDGSADTYEMQSVELGAHAVHHIGDSKAQLEDAVGAARASEVLEGKGVVPAWAHERLRRR